MLIEKYLDVLYTEFLFLLNNDRNEGNMDVSSFVVRSEILLWICLYHAQNSIVSLYYNIFVMCWEGTSNTDHWSRTASEFAIWVASPLYRSVWSNRIFESGSDLVVNQHQGGCSCWEHETPIARISSSWP